MAKRYTIESAGFADQIFKHDGKETTRVEHGDRFVSEADYEAVVKALKQACGCRRLGRHAPEELLLKWEDLIND